MSAASTMAVLVAAVIGVIAVAAGSYWYIASRARRENKSRADMPTQRSVLQNR